MKILVAVILSFICAYAGADNNRGFYIGVGMAENMYDDDVIDVSNSRAVELLGGYKYNAALGVEIRVGQGSSNGKSDTYNDPNAIGEELPGRLEREIDSYYAVYYKPELVNDEAKLYLLLGYMDIDSIETIQAQDGTVISELSVAESGASYGVGIGFIVTEKINFNIEYRTLPKQNDVESEIVSANFDYRF